MFEWINTLTITVEGDGRLQHLRNVLGTSTTPFEGWLDEIWTLLVNRYEENTEA